MKVSFYGVRGSFPSSGPTTCRYGGNTAMVALTVAGEPPIFLDLGTGLPRFEPDGTGPFRATALVSHLHLDHIQGLAFFPPVHRHGTELDIYAPAQDSGSLRTAFAGLVGPPYFPVTLDRIGGSVRFHEVTSDELVLGSATVMVRPVPHRGPTVGYRVAWGGGTIAYVSDHHAPASMSGVAPSVLELCAGVDLLIHEAQYTEAEYRAKPDWSHSTFDYALHVAVEAGARRLCLFHHDPWRTDDDLDRLLDDTRRAGLAMGLDDVTAAAEGATMMVGH